MSTVHVMIGMWKLTYSGRGLLYEIYHSPRFGRCPAGIRKSLITALMVFFNQAWCIDEHEGMVRDDDSLVQRAEM